MVKQKEYMPQLDSLRTFAVMAVLVEHFTTKAAQFGIHFGPIGVRLFFVLSGFLITGILLRCKSAIEDKRLTIRSAAGHFYIRRSLRIFPIYYLTLGVVMIVGQPPIRDTIIWHLTYTSNILFAKANLTIPHFNHVWSLSVEEQFYLVWPWIILPVPRKQLTRVIMITIIIAPLFRLFCLIHYGAAFSPRGTLTFDCLDSLGLGALLALYSQRAEAGQASKAFQLFRRHGLWIWIGLFVIYLLGSSLDVTKYTRGVLGELMYSLLFVWLVARAATGFQGGFARRLMENGLLMYLGRISYGIYLYHNMMPIITPKLFTSLHFSYPQNISLQFVILFTVTVLVAMMSWYLIERPLNNLKKYFL